MAPKKKVARRTRRYGIQLINVLESYAYASILTTGLFGNTPWSFVFDRSDIPKGMQ